MVQLNKQLILNESTFEITSLSELDIFVDQFAKLIRGGDRIGLNGELGAGKTTFMQLLMRRLGSQQTVESPTFTLRHTYPIRQPTFQRILHLDLYRLEALEFFEELALADEWLDKNSVIFIEWANRIADLNSRLTAQITFSWDPITNLRHLKVTRLP